MTSVTPRRPRAHALARLCAARRTRPYRTRIGVIVAHPDDEIIGLGGRLAALPNATIIQVTDGAPRDLRDALAAGCASREEYARVRSVERAHALALAGIGADRMVDIGLCDQEASRALVELTLRLASLLADLRSEVVLTHPYEGGHPDHDATAFAAHAAMAFLAQRGAAPVLLEFTSYHLRDDRLTTGRFPPDGHGAGTRVPLSRGGRALKQRMFDCHASQQPILASFDVDAERFRVAPRYNFARPPRGARNASLHYERHEWGMTGKRFRALAADALAKLRGSSLSS